ncbi:hypothetical protein [Micromonospora sp. CNB394]|nr:hypothetical protein [Micromonospora sp. CNB394]
MVNSRGRSVGRYLMRLVGGGVFLLKRSGPDRTAGCVPPAAR